MADTAQEKTEQPTPRRLKEAKEKGNVAKSTEINSVVVLFTGIFSLKLTLQAFGGTFNDFLVMMYHESSTIELTPQALPLLVMTVLKVAALIMLPVMISIMVAGFVSSFVQVGPLFAKKALSPDFSKMNPLNGIKSMFSPRSLVELAKGILKIGVVGLVAYLVVSKYVESVAQWAFISIPEIFSVIVSILMELSFKVGLALLIMAAADFGFQKYQHKKKMKMSKEEVKEESKQYEGNPIIKGAIKSKQRQLARLRMMKAVPEATVVVTNPTHIAIALKYEPASKSDAPKVVAKGKLKVAERIKQIARENGVPVIENKPLARGLYEACEVGMEIPVAFYQAVAEVLTQVYQMNKNKLPNLIQ
jgi:flagellar biosynthetic protein FlhB